MFDPLTSPVPYVLILALLGLLALALCRVVPFFRHLTAPTDPAAAHRILTLDGLRGLLAVSVFFHHAMIFHNYYHAGCTMDAWELPASDTGFYAACGKAPVWAFFMITGYLFWSKVLSARATGKRLSIRRLYTSRFRRLFPAYAFSLVLILALTALATHWTLRETPGELARHVGQWLVCGVADFPHINHYDITLINANITWTLRYEWYFYLLLPLLALLAAPEAFLCFAIGFLVFYAARQDPRALAHIANFLLGMTAAYVVPQHKKVPAPPLPFKSPNAAPATAAIAVCLAAMLLLYYDWHGPASLALRLLVFIPFLLILRGNTLCGLLTSRPARLLGAMSYSFYLLHGIVLSAALALLNPHLPIASLAPAPYWSLMAAIASATVLLSAVSYRFFEHPSL